MKKPIANLSDSHLNTTSTPAPKKQVLKIKCPICGSPMKKTKSPLPDWFNPIEIVKKTRPGMFKLLSGKYFTGKAYKEGLKTIQKNVETYMCPKCGFYAFFSKKKRRIVGEGK